MAKYIFWIAVGLLLVFSVITRIKTDKERKAKEEGGKSLE